MGGFLGKIGRVRAGEDSGYPEGALGDGRGLLGKLMETAGGARWREELGFEIKNPFSGESRKLTEELREFTGTVESRRKEPREQLMMLYGFTRTLPIYAGVAQEALEDQLGSHFRRELSTRRGERSSEWDMGDGAMAVLAECMERMREAAGVEGDEPVGEVLGRRRGRLPKAGNFEERRKWVGRAREILLLYKGNDEEVKRWLEKNITRSSRRTLRGKRAFKRPDETRAVLNEVNAQVSLEGRTALILGEEDTDRERNEPRRLGKLKRMEGEYMRGREGRRGTGQGVRRDSRGSSVELERILEMEARSVSSVGKPTAGRINVVRRRVEHGCDITVKSAEGSAKIPRMGSE